LRNGFFFSWVRFAANSFLALLEGELGHVAEVMIRRDLGETASVHRQRFTLGGSRRLRTN